MPGIKQFTTDDLIRSTNNWRSLTGGYNDPVNYVDLLGLSAGSVAAKRVGSRFVPVLGQALLLMDIYNHANERYQVRENFFAAGGTWDDLEREEKPVLDFKPDGSIEFNFEITLPYSNDEVREMTNELLKNANATGDIDVDKIIKDAIKSNTDGENETEPEPSNKQGPKTNPVPPIPPLGDEGSEEIYYRGLSVDDLEDYLDGKGIESHALRKGKASLERMFDDYLQEQLFDRHMRDSEKYSSPYVGMTDSEYWANMFAHSGEDPSGFIAKIKTKRAVYNNLNIIDPCNEYLVPGLVFPNEIIDVYKYGEPQEKCEGD